MKCDKNRPPIVVVFALCTLLVAVKATIRKKINTFEGFTITIPCSLQKDMEFPGVFKRRKRSVLEEDFVNTNLWTFKGDKPNERETLIGFTQISEKRSVAADLLEKDRPIYGEGGNDGDGVSACHFPFRYDTASGREKFYFTCIPQGRSWYEGDNCWCSPTPDATKDEKFVYCPCAEPRPGVRLMTVAGPDKGTWCVFPFTYRLQEYMGCIRKDDGSRKCWCATTPTYQENKWGYCGCASTAIEGSWSLWSAWSDCPCGGLTYRFRRCNRPMKMRLLPIGVELLCPGDNIEIKYCPCSEDEIFVESFLPRHMDIRNRSTPTADGVSGQITIDSLEYEDSGEYKCKRAQISRGWSNDEPSQLELGVYQVNVIDRTQLKMLNFDRWEVPAEVTHPSYAVVWLWSSWQRCDRCGQPWGEQRRIGFCYARVGGEDGQMFPCNSTALTWREGEKPPDYMNVRKCRDFCAEKVDVSLFRAEPGVTPPPIHFADRKVEKVKVGVNLTFHCPRSTAMTPVAWSFDRGGEEGSQPCPINRFTEHGNRSSKYVIDVDDSLMLVDVQDEDDGYYSCYVARVLTATYTVISEEYVVDEWSAALTDYGIYGSAIALLLAVLLAAVGVWKSKHHK